MTLTGYLTLIGLQALIAMSPGPAGVLTLQIAAASGLRAGLALATGLAVAIVLWAAAALTGLSLLFEVAPTAQTTLRLIGAAFLIWMGVALWRGADMPLARTTAPVGRAPHRLVAVGLATNLANPKALAYFAAVFAGLVPADPSWGTALAILGVVFAVEFAWYAVIALVFSRPAPQRAYARLKGRADRIFGAAVVALGARIAVP